MIDWQDLHHSELGHCLNLRVNKLRCAVFVVEQRWVPLMWMAYNLVGDNGIFGLASSG